MYCIVMYCIVMYCIVLYCNVLYCIVLYCIVLPLSQLRLLSFDFSQFPFKSSKVLLQKTKQHCNRAIFPRPRVGYELLDSGRGAEHRVGNHKLISNKLEWNNCFIKYLTLDKIYLEFYFLPTRVFGHVEGKFFSR